MLADYHLHCLPYSPDAKTSMAELFRGASEHGMTHICLTNHIEDCVWEPDLECLPPFRAWDELFEEFEREKAVFQGKMDIRLGAELSAPHYKPEEGRALYEHPGLDFVIGSIHNLRHTKDFYFYEFPKDFENLRPDVEKYLDEYIELAGAGMCDVLGHIGYMQRYMARQGTGFNIMMFEDRLRELFKVCVHHGVGIEVNTSGLRDKLQNFIPQPEVLKLYREKGGELITAGSDAHSAAGAGEGIREAYELMKAVGFKYVCLYKEHKPEFIRL